MGGGRGEEKSAQNPNTTNEGKSAKTKNDNCRSGGKQKFRVEQMMGKKQEKIKAAGGGGVAST